MVYLLNKKAFVELVNREGRGISPCAETISVGFLKAVSEETEVPCVEALSETEAPRPGTQSSQ